MLKLKGQRLKLSAPTLSWLVLGNLLSYIYPTGLPRSVQLTRILGRQG